MTRPHATRPAPWIGLLGLVAYGIVATAFVYLAAVLLLAMARP